MRTLCAALLAVLGGGTALPAYARDLQSVSEDARFSVALRSGFGIPLGDVVTGLAAQDLFSGQIPGWIDIGMRNETMFVGAYYQYGYVIPAHCPPGASCSGYTMRLGAEFLNRFMPRASHSPTGWSGLARSDQWI